MSFTPDPLPPLAIDNFLLPPQSIAPALSTFQVYYVPIYRTFHGVLTQLRLSPGVGAEEIVGERNASLSPRRGDAFEIDWVCMHTQCLRDIALLRGLKPVLRGLSVELPPSGAGKNGVYPRMVYTCIVVGRKYHRTLLAYCSDSVGIGVKGSSYTVPGA